jgi:hypothetical protein
MHWLWGSGRKSGPLRSPSIQSIEQAQDGNKNRDSDDGIKIRRHFGHESKHATSTQADADTQESVACYVLNNIIGDRRGGFAVTSQQPRPPDELHEYTEHCNDNTSSQPLSGEGTKLNHI